jgi:threonine/homoserine/homoserine lactone efflux protein
MSTALLEGISMGLLLSAMVGPVFFTLIQNSLENGFRHTAVLALGIFVSDLLYVLLTYFSVNLFAKSSYFEIILGYAGGLVLGGFGLSSIIKKRVQRPNSGGISVIKDKKRKGFWKGFSINGINPFVLLFWISIAGVVAIKDDFKVMDVTLYYAGILVTVFSIDLLKAFVAKQLSGFVTPKLMQKLNIGVGIFLVIFGIRLAWFAYEKHQALLGGYH